MAWALAEQALKRLSAALEDPGAMLDGATLGRLLALTTEATEQLKALCSASAQQVVVEELAGGLVLEDLAGDALEELAGGDLLRSVLQHIGSGCLEATRGQPSLLEHHRGHSAGGTSALGAAALVLSHPAPEVYG